MAEELKEAPGGKLTQAFKKKKENSINSREALSNQERFKLLNDPEEFSEETYKRNQFYIYLSLMLLLFSVVSLIVIT